MQSLRRRQPSWVMLLVLSPLLLVLAPTAGPSAGPGAAWADQGKKKLTTSQMKKLKKKMKAWAREIGKKCDFCHVKDGEDYDYEVDTPMKALGGYCDENFVQKLQTTKGKKISCATCHPGKPAFMPRADKKAKDGDGGLR